MTDSPWLRSVSAPSAADDDDARLAVLVLEIQKTGLTALDALAATCATRDAATWFQAYLAIGAGFIASGVATAEEVRRRSGLPGQQTVALDAALVWVRAAISQALGSPEPKP